MLVCPAALNSRKAYSWLPRLKITSAYQGKSMLKFIGFCVVVWFFISVFGNREKAVPIEKDAPAASKSNSQVIEQISPLAQLELSQPANLAPTGELADIFEFGGDSTDLQRQIKFKEINGTIIEWKLPVYEVKQSGDGYTIQTSGRFRGEPSKAKVVGTFLRISPRGDDDRRYVEKLKTGDVVKVKGVINDVTMRNLEISPAIIVYDDKYSKKVLADAYGKYNQKYDCWHTSIKNQYGDEKYCMRIGRTDKIIVGSATRHYVLAFGEHVDDEGNPNGNHTVQGLVGAFVIEAKNGNSSVIASNSSFGIGAFGSAPTEWDFVKLGSDNYWGWKTESGDCHHGECDSSYVLLAPVSKTIEDIGDGILASSSSESAKSYITSKLTIDATKEGARVYPLILSVMEGRYEGHPNGEFSPSKPNQVRIVFNEKKWRYSRASN